VVVTSLGRTFGHNARQHLHERQRHLGAVGLHKLPFVLLRFKLERRLTVTRDRAAFGTDLLQLRVHRPAVAEPIAYGEYGCHDRKAQTSAQRTSRLPCNFGGDAAQWQWQWHCTATRSKWNPTFSRTDTRMPRAH
jgi:hypothetical protein